MNLEHKEKLLQKDEDGSILARLCLHISFIFSGGFSRETREAVIHIFEEYGALMGPSSFRWGTNPGTGNWKKLRNGLDSYLTPKDWLLKLDPMGDWEFCYHNGQQSEDAPEIMIEATGCSDWEEEQGSRNTLTCLFPVDFFPDSSTQILKLALLWSSRLQPEQGYAGFILQTMPKTRKAAQVRYQATQRFPGLNLCFADAGGLGFDKGLRCVDWLTALPDFWVNKLGGLEAIEKGMGVLPVHKYPGGVILQAGKQPQLGDREQGHTLDAYFIVAKVIEPAREKNYIWAIDSVLGPDSWSNLYTLAATRAWLARFSPLKTGTEK